MVLTDAEATLAAALITAEATRWAGWISGGLGLFAGGLVVFGAFRVGKAQVKTQDNQNKILDIQNKIFDKQNDIYEEMKNVEKYKFRRELLPDKNRVHANIMDYTTLISSPYLIPNNDQLNNLYFYIREAEILYGSEYNKLLIELHKRSGELLTLRRNLKFYNSENVSAANDTEHELMLWLADFQSRLYDCYIEENRLSN